MRSTTALAFASEIVEQMNDADLTDYTADGWRDGVSSMLDGYPFDLDEVLSNVTAIVGDKRAARVNVEMAEVDGDETDGMLVTYDCAHPGGFRTPGQSVVIITERPLLDVMTDLVAWCDHRDARGTVYQITGDDSTRKIATVTGRDWDANF